MATKVTIDGKEYCVETLLHEVKRLKRELTIQAEYNRQSKIGMLTELKNKFIDKSWNIDMYDDDLDFECCYLNDIYEIIQQYIN